MTKLLAILLNIILLGRCIEVDTKLTENYGANSTYGYPLYYDGTNVYCKVGVGTPIQESGDTFVYLSSWISDLIVITKDAGMCGKPFYDYDSSTSVDIVESNAKLEILQVDSWRDDTNYKGMIVKDRVCLGEDELMCSSQFEFFAETKNSACKNMFGIQPSQNSDKPNLIQAMYAAGHINANMMTMYLDWNKEKSYLDLGITNSEYIVGDWSNHTIFFTNSASPSEAASFEMSGFKFNDVEYLFELASLVPINEQPYTITFGQNYADVYAAFTKAFIDITNDSGWWCGEDYNEPCQANNKQCSDFLGDGSKMTMPKIELEFDGQNYTIPAESLLTDEYLYCSLDVQLDVNNTIPSDWIVLG